MKPLVSVIIPTYNRWSYLQMTIDSVLAQTYPHIEIIVVNDGSTDQTAEMLLEYSNRVRVISQTNQGGTAARNTGLSKARGTYITFLDHDDLMLPNKLERQIALLEQYPEIAVAHCRWQYIGVQGNILDRIGPLPEGNLFQTLVLGCFLWSGAPVIRRDCFNHVGNFDTSIWSSDWDMWLRLAKAGYKFGCVQEILGSYRIMPDSTMSDVTRTEAMDIRLLDKTFASSQEIPQSILAVKDEAYANWRFWLSRRYYATNSPQDGERNLGEAFRLYPEILANRNDFLEVLCNEALDVRVNDPFAFVEMVFSHLPPAAKPIQDECKFVLSQVHIGLALRAYASDNFEIGRNHIYKAFALYADQTEHFAKRCVAYAMRLSLKPTDFVKTVLDHLPPETASLKTLRSRLMSDVTIASAFEDYFAGQHRRAGRQIVSAIVWQPSWLKNKGVLSVLAKSLPAILLNRD